MMETGVKYGGGSGGGKKEGGPSAGQKGPRVARGDLYGAVKAGPRGGARSGIRSRPG